MSSRTILSRPRTRVYDANYNIGESYYKSALDRLDRKYSGRPLTPPRQSPAINLPSELLERHERAFADEDLPTARTRAQKHIKERNIFDSRAGRSLTQNALEFVENDIDEETASTLKRIRAQKKISALDDVDFESTVDNLNSRRLIDRSDKVLRSVGLDDNARRALDEDVTIKRRSLRVTVESDTSAPELTKWSALRRNVDDEQQESAAAIRARQSRNRIADIEEEMAALTEKQAARERRAARFKALVAESADETEAAQSAIKAVTFRARREKLVEE